MWNGQTSGLCIHIPVLTPRADVVAAPTAVKKVRQVEGFVCLFVCYKVLGQKALKWYVLKMLIAYIKFFIIHCPSCQIIIVTIHGGESVMLVY